MFDNLKRYKIMLASNSPRRQELLAQMGVDFEVCVRSGIDERYPSDMSTKDVPEFLARKKASAYSDILTNAELDGRQPLLITADTVVICDKIILGKPHDERDAKRMLQMLQNNEHRVVSGVAITSSAKQISFSVKTKVMMRKLTDEQIEHYVTAYKPMDKAGAYGIQEWIGLIGIDYIEGSYHNVMGLPTQRLFGELMEF